MTRELLVLWLMISMFLPQSLWGEEQTPAAVDTTAMMQEDYIQAYVLIVSPASEPYSLFGHCALRLSNPSHQMDYCFTFETQSDTKGMLKFFQGYSTGGFAPAPTADYLDYYRQQGRGVTAYPLHLTPKEKLLLWKNADERIARGFSYPYGYMNAQCTSALIDLIASALSAPIAYHQLPSQLQGSFRDQMLAESEAYPWSRFFWQSIMGPSGDDTKPMEHKITPSQLPVVWQHATIGNGDRTLIANGALSLVVSQQAEVSTWWYSPVFVFTLLLLWVVIITIWNHYKPSGWLCRCVDGILLTVHTVLSLAFLYLLVFSEQEATSWNWYLLAFNPFPQLLWLLLPQGRVLVCRIALALMILTLLLTPLIPQLDLPHALFIGIFAVRLGARIQPFKQIKTTK